MNKSIEHALYGKIKPLNRDNIQPRLNARIAFQQCWRKNYHTFSQAEKVLPKIQAKTKNTSVPLHIYKCPFCEGYHIGHDY